jgi:general secretion pathway protein A
MLSNVLGELVKDGTLDIERPEQKPRPEPQKVYSSAIAPPPVDLGRIEHLETQIAELQQAIIELANDREARPVAGELEAREAVAAVEAKLAALESKLFEQERTIRHTLTMLIEMIEAEAAPRAAA